MNLPNWLRIHREPLPPSPIPKAAAETARLTRELARAVEQVSRINDKREARLQ